MQSLIKNLPYLFVASIVAFLAYAAWSISTRELADFIETNAVLGRLAFTGMFLTIFAIPSMLSMLFIPDHCTWVKTNF